MTTMQNTVCCPPFDPKPWHNIINNWDNMRFVKDHVITENYVPINFSEVVQRIMAKMNAAGAQSPDWLGLSDHTSEQNMDIYVATDREVPGIENVCISGKIFSRVYEGNFIDTGKWCNDFIAEAGSRGYKINKWYMWYTTCPECAKKYGKNYVVVLGEIAENF